MPLLDKGYLSKNNYNNITSVNYGEHNFIKKSYLNKFEKQGREIYLCVRNQTLVKIVVAQRAFADHYVTDD